MAGAEIRLPPMAVKLKGVTARTNPSRGRKSIRVHWSVPPGVGCSRKSRCAQAALKRQKSISSQAASISDCQTVLALAEHGGGDDPGAAGAGQQLGRLEEDRQPVAVRHPGPFDGGRTCRLGGHGDVLSGCPVVDAEL